MNIILKRILLAILLGFLIGVLLIFTILKFGLSAKPVPGDSILVLGCKVNGTTPSYFLQSRLNKALELYEEGYGKYIVVSGGQGPGEDISEAQAMYNYLTAQGVPAAQIILEDKSTSTQSNLAFSKGIMQAHDLHKPIIVSNTYHLKRISLLAHKENISASYAGVFVSRYPLNELFGLLREVLALGKTYIFG